MNPARLMPSFARTANAAQIASGQNKGMFGLGITEIIIILAVAAAISFFYWKSKKKA